VPHPKTALDLVNEVLTRCGQKAVGSLAAPATPVRQALSFVNQIYEEMRLTLALPTLKEQIELSYTLNHPPISLEALNTMSAFLNVNSVWVKSDSMDSWVSLKYEPVSHKLDLEETADTPTHFMLEREMLTLYPAPQKAGMIRMTVERNIERLDDATDVPALPYGSDYLVILGATGYLQHFLGEIQSSLMSFRLYEEGLLRLKKTYNPLFSSLRIQGNKKGFRQP
jgi:hypothetical protein